MDVGKFAASVVGIVVSVIIVVGLGIPAIANAVGGLDAEKDADIISMLEIIPLLLVVAIIMGIVALFVSRRE